MQLQMMKKDDDGYGDDADLMTVLLLK